MKTRKMISVMTVLFLALAVHAQIPTIEMVYVEGGEFLMGCSGVQHADCLFDERPAHVVVL